MAKRLTEKEWQTVWHNVQEIMEEEKRAGHEGYSEHEIEVTWLEGSGDNPEEWVLNSNTELLEDGFKSEREAMDRLKFVEQNYIK